MVSAEKSICLHKIATSRKIELNLFQTHNPKYRRSFLLLGFVYGKINRQPNCDGDLCTCMNIFSEKGVENENDFEIEWKTCSLWMNMLHKKKSSIKSTIFHFIPLAQCFCVRACVCVPLHIIHIKSMLIQAPAVLYGHDAKTWLHLQSDCSIFW